jgi:hypothetical protein
MNPELHCIHRGKQSIWKKPILLFLSSGLGPAPFPLSQLTQPPFLPLSSLCEAEKCSPVLASGGGTSVNQYTWIIVYIEYLSVCPFVEIGSPPLPQVSVPPPLDPKGVATFTIGMRGWEAQFGRLDRKPGTLYTLWVEPNHATGKKFDLLPLNYFMIPSMQTSKKPCFLEQNKLFELY